MTKNRNDLNNHEITHKGFGFNSMGLPGLNRLTFGFSSDRNEPDENWQVSAFHILRQLADASPFAFRTIATPVLGGALAGLRVRYPSVLYDFNCFGDSALYKKWRMYVHEIVGAAYYMLESDDGITWDAPVILATVPAGFTRGFHPFYNSAGLVTYDDGGGADTYNWASVGRNTAVNAGDATDMILMLSNDGVTWVQVVMANHDISGNPFGNELAASLGIKAVYMTPDEAALAFNAARPRSFFSSDGWHSFMQYQTEPAVNFGDTAFGCTIMGQNSNDDTDANEIGHFANWNRNLLYRVGARSFGQAIEMVPEHIVKFKDFYLALVQLWYAVPASPTLVPMGIGLAISKDGLIFESCGPLYDAGLVYALNDRTAIVDQTDMASTAYLLQQGVGTGAEIWAGSLVVDQLGIAFGSDTGLNNNRALARVYWTEEDSGRVLIGEI